MDKLKEIQSRINKYNEKHSLYSFIALIFLVIALPIIAVLLIFGATHLVGLIFFDDKDFVVHILGLIMILIMIIGMSDKYLDVVSDIFGLFANKFKVLQQIAQNMDAEYAIMQSYLQKVEITEDNYKELSEILHDITPIRGSIISETIQFDVNKFSEWYLEHVVTLDSFAENYISRDNDIMDCIRLQYCDYKDTQIVYDEEYKEFNDYIENLIKQAHLESKLNAIKIRHLLEDEKKLQEKINHYKANSLEYEGV